MTGLYFTASCRHCSGSLEQVNAGHADGCRSYWVGACVDCRRQWVITADIAQVNSRGNGRRS